MHDSLEPGVRILLRRDTTVNWATDNPVLMEGETGWDTDLRRVKLGDGVTAWVDLPWAADEAADVATEQARAEAAELALQNQIDAIEASDVETVAGVAPTGGDVATAGLKTALSLPTNTAGDLSSLDGRVDAIEATEATYGDIVTHNASEFTTDAELASVQTDVNTRKQRIAYTHDIANTAVSLTAGAFTALQPTFSVPPSTDDVSIRWGYVASISTGGPGSITIAPADVTSGSGPGAGQLPIQANLTGTFLAGGFSFQPGACGEFNFGPSATWRTFRLYGFVGRDSGSLTASMKASGTSPYATKTWMEAVLG